MQLRSSHLLQILDQPVHESVQMIVHPDTCRCTMMSQPFTKLIHIRVRWYGQLPISYRKYPCSLHCSEKHCSWDISIQERNSLQLWLLEILRWHPGGIFTRVAIRIYGCSLAIAQIRRYDSNIQPKPPQMICVAVYGADQSLKFTRNLSLQRFPSLEPSSSTFLILRPEAQTHLLSFYLMLHSTLDCLCISAWRAKAVLAKIRSRNPFLLYYSRLIYDVLSIWSHWNARIFPRSLPSTELWWFPLSSSRQLAQRLWISSSLGIPFSATFQCTVEHNRGWQRVYVTLRTHTRILPRENQQNTL